jgi:hypothetical protein
VNESERDSEARQRQARVRSRPSRVEEAKNRKVPSPAAARRARRVLSRTATFVIKGMKALAEVRELLWPKGDSDAEWTNETIEDVARAVDFLRPKPASTADAGFFRDAINDHDADAGELHVTSAVCRLDIAEARAPEPT